MIKSKFLAIVAAIILKISLCTIPTFAAQEILAIDDEKTVWIIGTDINGYSCWSLDSTRKPILQVKVEGKWVTKAKAKLRKDSSLCSDPKYPWVAVYNWRVDEMGEISNRGNLSRDLMAREVLPKYKNYKAYIDAAFVKQVYRNQQDLLTDYETALSRALGMQSSGNSGYGSSSKLSGCTFRGKKLYGKIQIVDFFPDIRVQVVDFFPDLKVQRVDYFPTSCGKWQFVDYFPDLKIQFVDYFPDLKIQYVDFFPGVQ
jgi:hypothetical protein